MVLIQDENSPKNAKENFYNDIEEESASKFLAEIVHRAPAAMQQLDALSQPQAVADTIEDIATRTVV
ncbi:uncharacterized protein BJX67DRAFT_377441 [Aspergillus lucknowensis]|uniref:Uncharacterized protein n=1 Tax=Aspergillus lucknowensis TaxID=176173 RepID=A0ABR4M519_9EURO